jgi:hypothetical protein
VGSLYLVRGYAVSDESVSVENNDFCSYSFNHLMNSLYHSLQRQGLKKRLREIIPIKQAEVKDVRTRLGNKVLGTCTVEQAYAGMRDVKVMVYETSLLDSQEVNNTHTHTLSLLSYSLSYYQNFLEFL